ncbi:hypothetical protein D3C86_879330 [compost metagenome]
MVIEPPACSNEAQKKMVMKARIITAIILSLKTGVYCEILFTRMNRNSTNATTIMILLPSMPFILKLNKFMLVILDTGSLMIHDKPITAIKPISTKSNLENGLRVASSAVSVRSFTSFFSGFKPMLPKIPCVK